MHEALRHDRLKLRHWNSLLLSYFFGDHLQSLYEVRLQIAFSIHLLRLKSILLKQIAVNTSVCMQPHISATGHLSSTYKRSGRKAWCKTVRALFWFKSWKRNMKRELISSKGRSIQRSPAQWFIVISAWQGQPWWQPRGPYVSWNN